MDERDYYEPYDQQYEELMARLDEPIKKEKVSFSTKMVVTSATAIIAYTSALFVLAFVNVFNKTNVWTPAELTLAWYGFWTAELVMLASIKKDKIKNKYEKEDGDERASGKKAD